MAPISLPPCHHRGFILEEWKTISKKTKHRDSKRAMPQLFEVVQEKLVAATENPRARNEKEWKVFFLV